MWGQGESLSYFPSSHLYHFIPRAGNKPIVVNGGVMPPPEPIGWVERRLDPTVCDPQTLANGLHTQIHFPHIWVHHLYLWRHSSTFPRSITGVVVVEESKKNMPPGTNRGTCAHKQTPSLCVQSFITFTMMFYFDQVAIVPAPGASRWHGNLERAPKVRPLALQGGGASKFMMACSSSMACHTMGQPMP